MNVIVIHHPGSASNEAIEEAVDLANGLQLPFELKIRTNSKLPNGDRAVKPERVGAVAERLWKAEGDPVIAVVDNLIAADKLVHEHQHWAIISTGWVESDIRLSVFILYQMASAMINFAVGLDDEAGFLHERSDDEELYGCLFDWWEDQVDLARCMVAGYICPHCKGYLRKQLVPDSVVAGIEKILNHTRAVAIARPTRVPRQVFVGHGHSGEWKQLARMLKKEGLDVVEFNSAPIAGQTNHDRLMHMLDRACFAFLVATAEDALSEGRVQPRPNVIHEMGLFQGRIGFKRTIVLLEASAESKVELPSNLDGVGYIKFEAGKLDRQRSEILRVLEREGVLRTARLGET